MNFLDTVAMRRVFKTLRPFLRPDERPLDYELADVEGVGHNTAVVLSTHAMYLMPKRGLDTVSVPYANIVDLQARGNRLIAVQTSHNTFLIAVDRPRIDLYGMLAQSLERVLRHKQVIAVPGGQVIAVCRPFGEGAEPVWMIMASDGVDLSSRQVREAVEETLRPVIEQLRIPLKWSD